MIEKISEGEVETREAGVTVSFFLTAVLSHLPLYPLARHQDFLHGAMLLVEYWSMMFVSGKFCPIVSFFPTAVLSQHHLPPLTAAQTSRMVECCSFASGKLCALVSLTPP